MGSLGRSVTSDAEKQRLRQSHKLLSLDWESYSFSQLCQQQGLKHLLVRFVSDHADDMTTADFEASLDWGAARLTHLILDFLKTGPPAC
jgi:nucleoside phosphorylase